MANEDWRFLLIEPPPISAPYSPNMTILGEMSKGRSKTAEFGLNRAGSAKTDINLTDEIAEEIFQGQGTSGDPRRGTIQRGIAAVRGGKVLWSGPIWTLAGNLPGGKMSVTAVGWFETLRKRSLRQNVSYKNNNPTTGAPWTDAEVAFDLLKYANTINVGEGATTRTWVEPGNAYGPRALRPLEYPQGTNIGDAIHHLSEMEYGFDYWVDPVTRQLNIAGAGSGLGEDHPEVQFGYKWGPDNLEGVSFQEDGSSMSNRVVAVSSQNNRYPAHDAFSQERYGVFEEIIQAGTDSPTILTALANEHVAVKAHPKITYGITPIAYLENNRVPRPFDDYNIGDTVRFSAKEGAFRVNQQRVRVYGISLSITEEGQEKISNLQISPD